jgi:hypothetical protein
MEKISLKMEKEILEVCFRALSYRLGRQHTMAHIAFVSVGMEWAVLAMFSQLKGQGLGWESWDTVPLIKVAPQSRCAACSARAKDQKLFLRITLPLI